ncbi:MAG: 4-alpha-glucanotransferase [Oscillospiraceae bacterium]
MRLINSLIFSRPAGQKVLAGSFPLGTTSYGDSPYQSFSSFAGNPYYYRPRPSHKGRVPQPQRA